MDEDQLKFISAVKEISATPAGKVFLDGLKGQYVRPSAVGKDPESTYYILSRKEFVLELLDLVEMDIEDLKVTTVTMEN